MQFIDYGIEKILDEINKGYHLICFGAGCTLDTFCLMFNEQQIAQYIEYIADNNLKLWNTRRNINQHSILIDSIHNIIEKLGSKIIIVITCQVLEDVYKQLEQIEVLRQSKLCFWGFVMDTSSNWKLEHGYMDCKIPHDATINIPKILHYCWFGKKSIPDRYREWMKSWKKYCPDYEIIEWNEANYDITKNKYMEQAYEAKRWGFVSDYARLDIIYQYGGVYLDTDVELLKTLNELLYQKGFCGFEDEYYVATGLGFGAVAKSNAVRKMRDYYNDVNFKYDDGKYNMTVCPIHQTKCLIKYGLVPNGGYQQLSDINVYPKSFFSPLNRFTGQIIKNKDTFSIHHGDASWLDYDKKDQINSFRNIYKTIEK